MPVHYPLRVPGWKGPEIPTEVLNPFDRLPVATVGFAPPEALAAALENARRAQDGPWGRAPAWRRAEILRGAARAVREGIEPLAATIAAEGGKPLRDARIEAARAAVTLEACADAARALEGEQVPMDLAPGSENRMAFTVREPIGVVLAISAFNHPLNLAAHQIGPALAAGCACLFKPAATTPISGGLLADRLERAGLPEGALQIVPCTNEDAAVLVASPRIDALSFIGSQDVGWRLRRRIAPGVRMGAEHGGNAAVVLMDDADLDRAVPLVTRGGYYHSGQVCVSTQRIYVQRGRMEEFSARLRDAVARLVTGDARQEATDCGPLILPREVDRVESWVGEAVAQGARAAIGGTRLGPTTFAPTILEGTDEAMKVMREEIFGPVTCLRPFGTIDEAVAAVNLSSNPFQAAIFTRDIDRAFHAAKAMRASAVMINDSTAFRVDWMPFYGRRAAGLGIGGVRYAVRELTEPKLLVMNLAAPRP